MASRWIFATMLAVAGTAITAPVCGQDPACGGACQHPCHGPCQYCVDGECVPRRVTYGYYEPNWRRWPVGPPDVCIPCDTMDRGTSLGSDVEPPSELDEAEPLPRFPHLRPSADAFGPSSTIEPELPSDPFGDEPDGDFDSAPASDAGDDFSRQFLPSRVRPVAYSQGSDANPLRGESTAQAVTRLPAATGATPAAIAPAAVPPTLRTPPREVERPEGSARNPLRG